MLLKLKIPGRLAAFLLCCSLFANADTTLVSAGSQWKYLDNGSDQGTAWRAPAFNDSAWSVGAAQLGYGDGDEATIVSFGPSSSSVFITTYFRHTFSVADPAAFSSLRLRLLRDDGAVVYLNGVEVMRSNMPTGTITSTTRASSAICCTQESTFVETTIASSLLVSGNNQLAVEIHQSGSTSSDISFDLALIGVVSGSTSVTRGPYLQSGSTNSVVVRWRTSSPTDSVVRYGTSSSALTAQASSSSQTTEHSVTLSGLSPDTTYFYSVGNTAQTLAGGADYFVRTAPETAVPTRMWVIGDSGTKNATIAAVRNAYQAFTGTTHTNLWLMLGDNAYDTGTDSEYQAAVFDMFPELLRKSVLWPTIGNHDSAHSHTATSFPYLSIFNLPTAGQAGGIASGTEKYYSFDYGNIHFICLDAMTSDRSATGAMATWLRNDLAATAKDWIIAFWHHPPYTKGSHDSDVEFELVQMRQNIVPILEDAGVDLVLSGHSHSYERSFLIDSHYGTASTFNSGHKVDGGSGRVDGTGAYSKPDGLVPHAGTVYTVAGNAGHVTGGPLNHPAMFLSLNLVGSLVIDVNGNRMDVKLLRETGAIDDYFTIIKGSTTGSVPAAPSALTATAASATRIDLAWTDNSSDESGFTIERSLDGTSFSPLINVAAGATSHADVSVSGGTTYWYRVRAFNSSGPSTYSNIASETTPASPGTGGLLANAGFESGLTGWATSGLGITVPTDPAQAHSGDRYARISSLLYAAVRGTDGSSQYFPVVPGDTIRYGGWVFRESGDGRVRWSIELTDSNKLNPSYFPHSAVASGSWINQDKTITVPTGKAFVRFYGEVYNSTLTTTARFDDALFSITPSATPQPEPEPDPDPETAPPAPSGLTATASSSRRIQLAWSDNSGNESGFEIERSTNGSTFSRIATVSANATSFNNNSLSSGTTYWYRVRAVNSVGASAYSNIASATTSGSMKRGSSQ